MTKKDALLGLDDCLRLKADMHFATALHLQEHGNNKVVKQLVGITVATKLCRQAIKGSLLAKEDRTVDEVYQRAHDALFSDDVSPITKIIIDECSKQGARTTLPVYRIIPLARDLLEAVIPSISEKMQNGEMEPPERVIFPWRIVNGLALVSQQTIDNTPPPSATIEEYAARVRADIETLGVERATRWIRSSYGNDGYVIHPVALASAAILTSERRIFGEVRSVLNITASSSKSGSAS